MIMRRYAICTWAIMGSALAACTEPGVSVVRQADMMNQGTQLQGLLQLGTQTSGMTLQGFQFASATLNGAALVNVRVDKGELVAEQNQVTLHGNDLAGAHLYAQWH